MKFQVFIASLLTGVATFAMGAIASFWVAFVFPPPHAKFTGRAAFQLGVVVSGYSSLCLTLALLATIPLYLRRVGPASLRHLLIYGAAVAFTVFFPAHAPVAGLHSVFAKALTKLANEVVALFLAPLLTCLVAGLIFCGVASVTVRGFRGIRQFASKHA